MRERLVTAALDRRWHFLYKQSHHQKLSHELENWTIPRNAQSVFDQPSIEQTTKSPNLTQTPRIIEPQQKLLKKVNFNVPMSATDVSVTKKLAVPLVPRSTALSTMTQFAIALRSQLDVPLPLKSSGTSKESLCPYCWSILNQEVFGDRSRWMFVLYFWHNFRASNS